MDNTTFKIKFISVIKKNIYNTKIIKRYSWQENKKEKEKQ